MLLLSDNVNDCVFVQIRIGLLVN